MKFNYAVHPQDGEYIIIYRLHKRSSMASTPTTPTQLLSRVTLKEAARRYMKSQNASNKKFLSELKRRISGKIVTALDKSGPKDMKLYIHFPSERKEIEKTGIMFEGDSKLCIEKAYHIISRYCETELDLSINSDSSGEGIDIKFKANDSVFDMSSSSTESDKGKPMDKPMDKPIDKPKNNSSSVHRSRSASTSSD